MLWLVVALQLACSIGATRIWPTDAQRIAMAFGLCVAGLGICWLLFEALLYARFPTTKFHTVAGRNTTFALAVVLVVQAIMGVAG